jgi:hypothetical protein
MLGRHVYRVSAAPSAGWQVCKDGEAETLGSRPSREQALRLARELATADEPSKIVVENPDGTIGDEEVFGVDQGLDVG